MTQEDKYKILLGRIKEMFPYQVKILTEGLEWHHEQDTSDKNIRAGTLYVITKDKIEEIISN